MCIRDRFSPSADVGDVRRSAAGVGRAAAHDPHDADATGDAGHGGACANGSRPPLSLIHI
eukprot:2488054-Alexandrium_andersonii.AAC.1